MRDSIDRSICELLQANARISNAEIGREIDMATSAVHARVRRLEEDGILQQYTTRVNRDAFGYHLTTFILLRLVEGVQQRDIGAALAEIEEVMEVHYLAGEYAYLLKVCARDTHHLAEIIRGRLGRMDTGLHTRSMVVLSTEKESLELPWHQMEMEHQEER